MKTRRQVISSAISASYVTELSEVLHYFTVSIPNTIRNSRDDLLSHIYADIGIEPHTPSKPIMLAGPFPSSIATIASVHSFVFVFVYVCHYDVLNEGFAINSVLQIGDRKQRVVLLLVVSLNYQLRY